MKRNLQLAAFLMTGVLIGNLLGGFVHAQTYLSAVEVPRGTILLMTTACPSGYTEVTALNGAMPLGTIAANGDVGTTGGTNTITPTVASLTAAAQTVSYPVNVPTIAAGSFTQPTISWPVGVPTNGAIAIGTFVNVATTTSGNSAATNIAAGTGSLTAAKATAPNLTVPAEGHSGSLTPPTISWPAGVPTNASGAFSEGAISWPANPPTNGTSSVTGTLSSFDNRSAWVKVIFCQKA
jgi:hypothetical protein